MRTQRSMPTAARLARKLQVILAVTVLAAPMAAWTGGELGSAPVAGRRDPRSVVGEVLIAGGAFAPTPTFAPAGTPTRTPGRLPPTPPPPRGPTPTPTPALAEPPAHERAAFRVGLAGHPVAAELYNPNTGEFSETGRMVTDRENHTATLLGHGKVLIAGGTTLGGCKGEVLGGCRYLSSAELYDPSIGTFRATGHMASRRRYHAAVLLRDGRVLVTGGGLPFVGLGTVFPCNVTGDIPTDTAELYDPRTGRFAPAGPMTDSRELHTATPLSDGTVLIAGGICASTAELYQPASGRFVAIGEMTVARAGHTATLLADGEVLITGGTDNNGKILASAELYDPSTGIFTATGSMNQPRRVATATLLTNGDVLVAGGLSPSSRFGHLALASAELYDPSTGSFTPTGSMSTSRGIRGTATLLDDGRVLVAAGDGTSAELYDPVTGSFSPTGNLAFPRLGATATLLR